MANGGRPILPGAHKAKPAGPFPIGAKVLLARDPHGQAGIVREIGRKKVTVQWRDLGYRGKHTPASLILADSAEPRAEGHQTAQDGAEGAMNEIPARAADAQGGRQRRHHRIGYIDSSSSSSVSSSASSSS